MPTKRRTPIKLVSLSQPEYEQVRRAKEAYEVDQGKKTDWGGFLLFLGLAYLIGRGIDQQRRQRNGQE